MLENTECAI